MSSEQVFQSEIVNLKSEISWLWEKDSNLQYCVQSAACCPVTPSHKVRMKEEMSDML